MGMGEKKGERSILKVRTSRKVYLLFYLMVAALWIIIFHLHRSGTPPGKTAIIFAIIFTLIVIKSTELHRLSIFYEITSGDLVDAKGIFNRRSKRTDYFAVSDIDVMQNLWQRLLNFGDVNVHLYSTENLVSVKNINKPYKFARALSNTMDKRRRDINVGEE